MLHKCLGPQCDTLMYNITYNGVVQRQRTLYNVRGIMLQRTFCTAYVVQRNCIICHYI